MKNFTKKVLAMLTALLPISVFAADPVTFTQGEISYTATSDKTCTLTSVTTECPVDLVIPATVTNNNVTYTVNVIGPNALDNCPSMNSIVIPGSIIYIANGAFFKPTKIKTITCLGTTPPDVTSSPFATLIYSGATLICPPGTYLAYTLAIPRMYNVVEEGYKTCTVKEGDVTITYVTVSEKDKLARFNSISPKPTGEYTMPDEVELEGVKYKVAAVKNSAFGADVNLTGIKLSKNILTIGASAFSGCTKLESIEIPEGCVHMNTSVFQNCSSMVSCKVPSTMRRFESNIFSNCVALKSINLPECMEYMGQSCFPHCESLETVTGFEYVDSIAGMMFGYCYSLKNVKFPTSKKITLVPSGTFQECRSLESIEIPENVKELGMNAFVTCPKLKSVKLHDGITVFGASAFAKDSALAELKMPAALTTINASCFQGCISFTSLEFPVGVTKLPSSVFSGCRNLKTVTFKGDLTEIGMSAFSSCQKLEFTIPETVTKILGTAFSNNLSLTSVKVPESVTSIGSGAFQYCTNLVSAEIPKSIKILPSSLFYACKSLKEVKMADDITTIGVSTFRLTGLDKFVIPSTVTTIGNYAFMGDSLLTSITIPESVISLGISSFRDCAVLPEVTLPAKLESIGATSFAGCKKLMTVTSLNPEPPYMANSNAFDEDTYKNAKLLVPAGAEKAYKEDDNWKLFTNFGTSNFEDLETSEWIVTGNGYIESTIPVTVYTVTGRVVDSFTGYKAVAPGLYIVKGFNKVAKVIVK